MPVYDNRFDVWVNEGGFAHDPMLTDKKTNTTYPLGRGPEKWPPPEAVAEFAAAVLKGTSMDGDTATFMLEYVKLSAEEEGHLWHTPLRGRAQERKQ